MKIVKLTISNFMKLGAVEIEPCDGVVRITGRNGQGKSSVLNAIWAALGGGKTLPEKPVREGAESGEIRLDLGDLVVTRRFTAGGGTSLFVANAEGARYQSPQAILDALVGRLSFDPLAFARLDTKSQAELLRDMVGLNTADLDAKRASVYAERTIKNREAAALAARADAARCEPCESPDLAALLEQIRAEQASDQRRADVERDLRDARAKLGVLDEEIAVLEEKLRSRRLARDEINARIDRSTTTLAALPASNMATLNAEFASAQQRMANAKRYSEYAALRDQATAAAQEAEALTAEIKSIDAAKEARIRAVDMPLPDLSLSDDGVLYRGLPLSQASSAEQLRVSLAIAMRLNPKLRVLRVTDGSLLDSNSMQIVEEMAREHDYQVWVECVDETGAVGIVIQDGAVAAVNAA